MFIIGSNKKDARYCFKETWGINKRWPGTTVVILIAKLPFFTFWKQSSYSLLDLSQMACIPVFPSAWLAILFNYVE